MRVEGKERQAKENSWILVLHVKRSERVLSPYRHLIFFLFFYSLAKFNSVADSRSKEKELEKKERMERTKIESEKKKQR